MSSFHRVLTLLNVSIRALSKAKRGRPEKKAVDYSRLVKTSLVTLLTFDGGSGIQLLVFSLEPAHSWRSPGIFILERP